MDLTNFAVLLFIYLIGFRQVKRAVDSIEKVGFDTAMLAVVVYGIILICVTIYVIATHYLPWWGIILSAGIGALPWLLGSNR